MCRKVRFTRGPTGRLVFGTRCHQQATAAPVMRSRLPDSRSTAARARPGPWRSSSRRVAPKLTEAMSGCPPVGVVAVTVPPDGVAAIAVEIGEHRIERPAGDLLDAATDRVEPWREHAWRVHDARVAVA